jgi:demethylmenaquinone methyltransferase/2-methoxy-6-polyprenyl-1,4-benzoquinol methylase
LTAGETVIDVACGTGLTFALIEDLIGPDGRVIGMDLSPEMLAKRGSASPPTDGAM